MILIFTFFIIAAYLLGSLSSAVIVCKIMNLPDPRTQGSGNPGATNVLRIGGKFPALLVLFGDVLKGLMPVIVAKFLGTPYFVLSIIAFAATLGHMYPLFFNFTGGKGVATALGGLVAINLWLGLFTVMIWIGIVYFTRYVSLASIVSLLIAALCSGFFTGSYITIIPLLMLAGLIIYRHKENIVRLKQGTESKFNLKSK